MADSPRIADLRRRVFQDPASIAVAAPDEIGATPQQQNIRSRQAFLDAVHVMRIPAARTS